MNQRANYLSPPDFQRLQWACQPIRDAFGRPPYLVGSVLTRPDYRDIDLRLILDDNTFEPLRPLRQLLNVALSDLIANAANLPAPVDFQLQSMTEANIPEHGCRHAVGIRALQDREDTTEVAELRSAYERAANRRYEIESAYEPTEGDAGRR